MFTICKATIEDIPILEDLQKQLHGTPFEESHNDLKTTITQGHVWIVVESPEDGETPPLHKKSIVGYGLCELFDRDQKNFPNSIFLSELFVTPAHRSKGVGSLLVKTMLNEPWPKEYNYFSLTHDPNEPHLTEYYKKFGFTECGKTDAENIKMIKPRS